jgi:hypothetical protein
MNLSHFASNGPLVSAIVVLVSLLYLSVQVRQAHHNQQASIRQARSTRIVNLFMAASNPSVADAIAKGIAGAEDVSNTQFEQFRYYCMAEISHAEDSFYQHQDGLLNDAAFETFVRALKSWFRSSGVRALWKRARNNFTRDFIEFMDKVSAETPAASSGDDLAQWKADVIAEQTLVMHETACLKLRNSSPLHPA